MSDKQFPIQPQDVSFRKVDSVAWEVAEEAYSEYADQHGSQQTLERLAERGGFCAGEIIQLLFERCRRLVRERDAWRQNAGNEEYQCRVRTSDWAKLYKSLGVVRLNLATARRALQNLWSSLAWSHAHDGPEPCRLCAVHEEVRKLLVKTDWQAQSESGGPTIVCLCGSTRFSEAFRQANMSETLAGRIVLTIGCDFKSDDALGLVALDKVRLDELHRRKIDLADEILVLNVSGYIGESTRGEIQYATEQDKPVRYWEPNHNAEQPRS